jgi:RND family efflux transporter MFP subunit
MKKLSVIASAWAIAIATSVSCNKSDNRSTVSPQKKVEVAEAITDSIVIHRNFPGYLKAVDKADVVARVSGVILQKCYKSGSLITKGDLLFKIDPEKYIIAVEQAEATLLTAQEQYDYYKSQYDAMVKAYQADAVSKISMIQAESNMKQARSSIKNAQAALRDAKINLSYCTVTAPISGTISDANIDVGNYVDGAASPVKLCTIVDNTQLEATFSIEDTQSVITSAPSSNLNTPLFKAVPIKFQQTYADSYTTDLYYIAPSVNESTGTLTLKGYVANTNGKLKDGMFVMVSLPIAIEPNAILVKNASVGNDQLGKYLYTVNDSDKVVLTHIATDEIYQDSLCVVTKGISPGTKYVTKALLTVRNGEKITPLLTQ